MTISPRFSVAASLVVLVWASVVGAQTLPPPSNAAQQGPAATPRSDESRPATTTFLGDTGLWYVPTAEILADRQWSVSGYRRGTNYIQGYSNVADFAGTFAVGIKDRAEVFGSFLVDTRIDRDVRPLFVNDPAFGGLIDRDPRVNTTWTGDHLGDLYLGAKFNLLSESRQNPAALALRGIVKVPTGDKDVGVSTGKADVIVDAIVSKEMRRRVDFSGYAGFESRGKPDGIDIPANAFHWGVGAGFPSRSPVRIFAELNGTVLSNDTVTLSDMSLVGVDSSRPPLTSNTENITRATAGITLQSRKGIFVGGGLSWSVPTRSRVLGTPFGDYVDWQVRIGYHPGTRVYVAPPPPPPPPPPPVAQKTHTLTVRAQANPSTVDVGKASTVTATVQDSIGCVVTYRWSAPTGTFANPAQQQTIWTAPNDVGSVPVTVTVTCPSDGMMASDTVSIQVTRPPVKQYVFEDVYFDFDRYTLRPDATRVLDEAITALKQDPTLRVNIEGYTCSIGTAEYNLALGERRATAVREYLVSRGVGADRLRTTSYGEERPKFDNAREETRRLNRRAALVVNLQ